MVMVEKEDIRKTSCPRLNNKEFLDVLAGGALGHAVPGCVAQGAADGPHDGDGDFSGAWALGLGSHLHHASGAARGAGRVVPDGGWSSALASQGGGNRGAGSNTGKHGWMLRICRVLLKEVAREDGLSETTDRLFVATSGWVGGDCLVKC